MCGRVIQNSGPLRYAFVDGMTVRDSRVHNYPPRWNAAPSQELLVIRRNHRTGEVSLDPLRWGLIPHWCNDPSGGRKPINAKCETVRNLPTFREGEPRDDGHQRASYARRRGGATALARRAFGGIVHAVCKGRRTMACAITSMFLMAMFGIVTAAMVFRPSTKEKPSARRQETSVAPSGDRVIA
jgi:hypothetical protein